MHQKACSCAGGYNYLRNKDGKLFNDPIYILAKVIKPVMSAASETECGALFINAPKVVPMRTTLEELNWKQAHAPLQTDNNAASRIMNNTVKQKKYVQNNGYVFLLATRLCTIRYVLYLLGPSKNNLRDYFIKRFIPPHHKKR